MHTAKNRKLLFDVIAWRHAPLLSLALSDVGQSRKTKSRNSATDAAGRLCLIRIAFVVEFLNPFSRAGIESEVRCGCPFPAADDVRHITAQHLSPEMPRVQRVLRGLLLEWMGPSECH